MTINRIDRRKAAKWECETERLRSIAVQEKANFGSNRLRISLGFLGLGITLESITIPRPILSKTRCWDDDAPVGRRPSDDKVQIWWNILENTGSDKDTFHLGRNLNATCLRQHVLQKAKGNTLLLGPCVYPHPSLLSRIFFVHVFHSSVCASCFFQTDFHPLVLMDNYTISFLDLNAGSSFKSSLLAAI